MSSDIDIWPALLQDFKARAARLREFFESYENIRQQNEEGKQSETNSKESAKIA